MNSTPIAWRKVGGLGWLLCLAGLLCFVTDAVAQPTTGLTARRSMAWGAIGFQADSGGSLNSSGIGRVNNLPAEINANTWGERYDAALTVRYGIAFNLTDNSQLFAAGHWEQAEADDAVIGLLGGQPLNATFDDYQGWGLDFGYRRFLRTTMSAKPFVAGSIGFQHVESIAATLTSAPNNFIAGDVPFYDSSWVPQWRLGTGFLWDVTPRWGWQVTIDFKFSGVLSDQAGLGTLGFERVNDTGNRLTLPILAGVYYKF
jgi:hypothetical protein